MEGHRRGWHPNGILALTLASISIAFPGTESVDGKSGSLARRPMDSTRILIAPR